MWCTGRHTAADKQRPKPQDDRQHPAGSAVHDRRSETADRGPETSGSGKLRVLVDIRRYNQFSIACETFFKIYLTNEIQVALETDLYT